jgi:glycosyltransferase involved in cell wall biosynthesis
MRFSVVMPVYNRPQYMHREAIGSVLAQTFKDYELIVVDDGSTDETQEVLASYGSRLKVLRQPNSGAETARHNGARHAQGEYIVFLDSDDLLCSGALEAYDHVINECSLPPLIIGSWIEFEDGSPLPEEVNTKPGNIEVSVYKDFLSRDLHMGLSNSLIVIRKSILEKLEGPQRTAANLLLDDFHICLQTGTASPCVVVRKPITVGYRRHSNNAHQNPAGNVKAILSLIDYEQHGGYPGGKARRNERYLWIGSISLHWIRKWLAANTFKFIYPLVLHGSPMLAIASVKKIGKYMGISRSEPLLILNRRIESLTDRGSQNTTGQLSRDLGSSR